MENTAPVIKQVLGASIGVTTLELEIRGLQEEEFYSNGIELFKDFLKYTVGHQFLEFLPILIASLCPLSHPTSSFSWGNVSKGLLFDSVLNYSVIGFASHWFEYFT